MRRMQTPVLQGFASSCDYVQNDGVEIAEQDVADHLPIQFRHEGKPDKSLLSQGIYKISLSILAKRSLVDVSDRWGIVWFGKSYDRHVIKSTLPQCPPYRQPRKQEEDKDEQLEQAHAAVMDYVQRFFGQAKHFAVQLVNYVAQEEIESDPNQQQQESQPCATYQHPGEHVEKLGRLCGCRHGITS